MAKWPTALLFFFAVQGQTCRLQQLNPYMFIFNKNDQLYFLLKILLSKWIWKGLSIYVFYL
jgi:hypothetical protein